MKKMKRKSSGVLFFFVGLFFFFAATLQAADQQTKPDNLKWGPVYGRLSAGLSLRWTDNIGLNEENENVKGDWLTSANLSLGIRYPITPVLELGFLANLAATSGTDHNDTTGGLVGTSTLSVDFPLAGWKINVHDQYNRATDPTGKEIPYISNVREFARTYNTAGISGLKEFNKVKLNLGFDYASYRVEKPTDFRVLDRDTSSFFGDLAMALNPQSDFFLRVTRDDNNNVRKVFNDSTLTKAEVGLRGRMTPRLQGEVAVGYEELQFDHTGTITDTSGFDGLIYRGSLTHQITKLTVQNFSFNYKPSYGYNAGNYYEWFNLYYSLSHQFAPRLTGLVYYNYDDIKESGSSHFREKATRNQVGVGTSYQLSKKMVMNLDYSFINRDSNRHGKSYQQNNVIVSLAYNF